MVVSVYYSIEIVSEYNRSRSVRILQVRKCQYITAVMIKEYYISGHDITGNVVSEYYISGSVKYYRNGSVRIINQW